MKWLACAALVVSMVCAAPASAQFYKYLDRNGHVRFTDDINHVPPNQRTDARSYEPSLSSAAEAPAPDRGAESKSASPDAVARVSPDAADPALAAGESIDTEKERLEAVKKQLDADYQALATEKETLGKQKEQSQSRAQLIEYNKSVEEFNKKAGELESRGNELRRQVEAYNARVIEENAKMTQSAKK
jgi:hypothetical protein